MLSIAPPERHVAAPLGDAIEYLSRLRAKLSVGWKSKGHCGVSAV